MQVCVCMCVFSKTMEQKNINLRRETHGGLIYPFLSHTLIPSPESPVDQLQQQLPSLPSSVAQSV